MFAMAPMKSRASSTDDHSECCPLENLRSFCSHGKIIRAGTDDALEMFDIKVLCVNLEIPRSINLIENIMSTACHQSVGSSLNSLEVNVFH